MKLFECHISFPSNTNSEVFDLFSPDDWKIHSFANYSYDDYGDLHVVKEETLATCEMSEYSSKTAAMQVFLDKCSEMSYHRLKIETPINSSYGQALYHEAHYKLKNPTSFLQKLIYNDSLHLFPSHNITSNKWWITKRGTNYECFVMEHKLFMIHYANDIEEFEIESVIFDTNIEQDYEWMQIHDTRTDRIL